MADVKNVSATAQSGVPNIVQDVLNLWPVKILTSFLPGGGFISDVLTQITQYIEAVEKAVALKGAGVAKKSIVENATVKYILTQYPELSSFDFIVTWAVDEIIDFIVHMKKKFGWNWIPIQS
ncbi:MAG: hypothetical protein OH335_04360 [Candidatus Parvarchaeota archaeon]|nr:hypothetical protein [Candidatus Jingweiarchaeum tengchongense]